MAAGKCMIGVDLGGTKILAVVVDPAGRILARAKTDTPAADGLEAIARRMKELADEALKTAAAGWENVGEVGCAVPASVDPATGVVLHSPALNWRNQAARPAFEKAFGKKVFLDNDVNCGVLAEARLGAGRGVSCLAGYFVGTGTGGGIVINGRLHRGRRGCAGELGHEIVQHHGRRCGCGKRGCLEAYCSKTAFARRLNKLVGKLGMKSLIADALGKDNTVKSKALAKAYRAGDPVVCRVVDKGAAMLGVAVANLMAILAPDCIVLGGGVMEAFGAELLPKVRASAEQHLFGLGPDDLDLRLSELGDDAVPLGAALLPAEAAGAGGGRG